MEHIQSTPHPPELEIDDDDLPSKILAIFHLSMVPGWVYIAITGDHEPELCDNIEALVKECQFVFRDNTAITLWNDDCTVLSMGTGEHTFYKIIGQEFVQTFQCLAHPPLAFYSTPNLFSVGKWVCIGCPGIYWGDVGLLCSLADEEDEDHITVLLVLQITDAENLAVYLWDQVHPPLMKYLCPHSTDDPPLFTDGGEETWIFGRDRMTKDGLLLQSFAPWELRKEMTDGTNLYLLPEQETHFRGLLPPSDLSHMPPICDPQGNFIRGERVHIAGHNGIIVGFDKSVGPQHGAFPLPKDKLFYAELERIYSETWKGHIYCHPSFMIKQHNRNEMVFSLGLKENVEVVECDYFKEEVTIQL
jgi:hypothetical protein